MVQKLFHHDNDDAPLTPRHLGHKSLVVTATNTAGSMLGMLIAILVARRLGPDVVGALGVGIGLAGIAMALVLPGFAQAHVKRLAEGQDPGRCIGAMLTLHGAMLVVLVPLVAIVNATIEPRRGLDVWAVFVMLLVAQFSARVADIYLAVFLVRESVVEHAAIVLAARVARLLVTVGVLVWAPSVVLVAATFAVEGIVSGIAGAGRLAVRHGIRLRAPRVAVLRSYWAYARPLLVTNPLALFQDSIDRVLVGRWAGLAAAGHYHVARALWEALASLMAAPALFLFTRLSALFARSDPPARAEARDFFFNAVDKLLFISVPLALVLWTVGEWLIRLLYGAAFAPAAMALRVLVLATVAANIVNPYTLVLFARDEIARFVPVNVLRVVVYVVTLALLVPETPLIDGLGGWIGGATGAAVCRLFLVLFPAWVYFRWTRDLLAIPLYPRVWVYVGGFGAAIVVERAVAGVGTAVDLGAVVTTIAAAVLSLALYAAIIALAHPEAGKQFSYALSTLSPAGLWNSVRRERPIR